MSSFNRWVNSPPCQDCGNKTVGQGMGVALPSETLYGASRVELYRYGHQIYALNLGRGFSILQSSGHAASVIAIHNVSLK